MDDPLLALLALMDHHPSRAALARELFTRAPFELATAPAWRPGRWSWHRALRQRRALAVLGIQCIPWSELPPRLARVVPPPPALFCRGDSGLLSAPAIAVVGARRASSGPLAWAAVVARAAARHGLVVVSGGAIGVDAAAHRAVLAAGGRTVVYHGVQGDRIYPRRHRRLFEQVLERGGALVSEHPPLGSVFPACHAARNRFIAGHASVVLVAEARVGSGSLGTAAFAHRLGVPVLVPPAAVGGERAGISELLVAGKARELASEADLEALLASAAGQAAVAAPCPEELQGPPAPGG